LLGGRTLLAHKPPDAGGIYGFRVAAGREFQDAVPEVLAANAQLLVLARPAMPTPPVNAPTLRACCGAMRPSLVAIGAVQGGDQSHTPPAGSSRPVK